MHLLVLFTRNAVVMSDYVVIRGVSRCTDVPRGNYPRRMAFSLLGAGGWVITYFMGGPCGK